MVASNRDRGNWWQLVLATGGAIIMSRAVSSSRGSPWDAAQVELMHDRRVASLGLAVAHTHECGGGAAAQRLTNCKSDDFGRLHHLASSLASADSHERRESASRAECNADGTQRRLSRMS